MTHIPEDEGKAVLLYMQRCLVVLRLSDWDVILSDEPCDIENNAEVNAYNDHRYIATLLLPTDWAGKPRSVKKSTLMHECLHILHAQQEQAIRMLEGQTCMSKDVYDLMMDRYGSTTEYMVDKLTHVLSDLDALPPWPTPRAVAAADLGHTRKGGIL